MTDQELDNVFGGYDAGSCSTGPGSPTNNTLHSCPVCSKGFDYSVGEGYPLFWKGMRYGYEVFICQLCCHAYAFNEAGEIIDLGQQ